MWKFKTNREGKLTPAVQRRLSKCEVDLTLHKSRSKFGYNYLENI